MFDIVEGMATTEIHLLEEQITQDRVALRERLREATAAAGAADRELLRWAAACDRAELFRGDGARTGAQWLSAQLGISNHRARRFIAAGYALEHLTLTSAALASGSLSLDKTIELTRFATASDEKKLLRWARRVTVGGVRERADRETQRRVQEVTETHEARFLRSWVSGDDRIYLEALLPSDQGTALMEAVDHLAHELPKDPGSDSSLPGFESDGMDQRRADALVLLAASGGDGEVAKPTVVLHAPLAALAHDEGNCSLTSGHVLHPEVARQLCCDARLQVVLHGEDGNAVGIGHASQIAPMWLRRQVFHRDGYRCTFPGCEMKRFLAPHHILHWSKEGPTDLDNLVTVCSNHHSLIHRCGWDVALEDGHAVWFQPRGRRYEPGPAPPEHPPQRSSPDPHRLGQAAG
jgi:hypothetical protein